ncbi:MAG: sigma-54-dependent transcriptional regulator [Terriglobia bacterium]
MALKLVQQIDDENQIRPNRSGGDLLGPSVNPVMQTISAAIADIAATNIPVLISGETGTGKEVVALAIHQLSRRSSGLFLKLRCSRLSAGDFYSRLAAAEADDDTLTSTTVFLDEIADINPECQALLLESFSRPREGPESFQLGGSVISTSCRNVEDLMQAGFRRDLFYRLSGIRLRLPPLRERREDIVPLARFFAEKYSNLYGRPCPQLSASLAEYLNEHSWPGNIRELENTMKRVVALGNDSVAMRELGERAAEAPARAPNSEGSSLKEAARAAARKAEKELILKVLSRTRWNRKRAAEELQISYKALLYKLKQIGLEEPAS